MMRSIDEKPDGRRGTRDRILRGLVLSVSSTCLLGAYPSHSGAVTPKAVISSAHADLSALPLNFEANFGQAGKSDVQYVANGKSYGIALTQRGAVLALGDDRIRMQLLGSPLAAIPTAEQPLPGKVNYLIGNDPTKWRTDVPTYGKVRYTGVYPGVDLVYYGNQGHLEYDFAVAPGADPGRIGVRFEGAQKLLVDTRGNLAIRTHGRGLTFERPIAYQLDGARRVRVAASYRVAGNAVRFAVGRYDHSRALIVDPVLSYLSYLGGSSLDQVGNVPPSNIGAGTPPSQSIAIDSANNIYVTGATASTDFPTQAPFAAAPTKAHAGWTWAFVTKIAPDAKSLVYSTYLGGSNGLDAGNAIAVDAQGDAFVVGAADSSDFPTTSGAYQRICAPNFPTPNNPASTCGTGNQTGTFVYNAFVTKLGPSGALLASTFLGGSAGGQGASAVAVDSAGRPYVVGTTYPGATIPAGNASNLTQSVGFPTTTGAVLGPYVYSGNSLINGSLQLDAFVSVFDPNLTTLVYSTLLGDSLPASHGTNQADTVGAAIAVDSSGNFYVGARTEDAYVPTTAGSLQPAIATCGTVNIGSTSLNDRCGYVAKFTPVGGAHAPTLAYGTYFGGTASGVVAAADEISGLAVDATGDLYILGYTNQWGIPTTAGAFQTTCNGYNGTTNINTNCTAAFISKLNPTGSALLASTYFGCVTCSGDAVYLAGGIALDTAGNVYFGGIAGNSLPLVNGFPPASNAGGAAPFIAELDPTLATVKFATLLDVGGAGQVATAGLVLDATGAVYVAGSTIAPTASAATSGVFQAAYGGGSSDGWVAKIVVTVPTTTTLTAAPSSATAGTAVAFTALVKPASGTGVPSGTVTFNNGSTVLGTGTLNGTGQATFSTAALAVGSNSVTAVYGGDTGDSTSTSSAVVVTITSAPVASTTTLVAAPTSATVGAAVTFTATVAPASGTNVPSGTVTFKDGTTTLGSATLSAGKATYTNSALALGPHSITAAYAGDAGDNASTSSAVTVTMTAAAPAAPTGVTATAGNAQVTLSWTASSGATSYSVYQGTSAGGESNTAVQTGITGTSVIITGLTNGSPYYFTVAAVNAGGTSSASSEASATPAAPPSSGGGTGHHGGGALGGNGLLALLVLATIRAYRVRARIE